MARGWSISGGFYPQEIADIEFAATLRPGLDNIVAGLMVKGNFDPIGVADGTHATIMSVMVA